MRRRTHGEEGHHVEEVIAAVVVLEVIAGQTLVNKAQARKEHERMHILGNSNDCVQ